ncbi:uncharacterized protein A1O9_03658 [Exophiala aquamarina CBS 119918]|uniref:Monopolin complex subunit Csm1/Pcs1 C-terminal domain-containing protein n=1 Tax=Exophiala aquamarina CBS 119918 TaxID=1182545 RepID=A0A072PTK0_9EURO|nr:uncharacterized protein A1O9_03658 [Exophiala aquamarina CBS 119918]KEF58815.1 hypothetical protein A1O9_03658 [Exophiala aquamarina CBS 119918]
MKGIADLLDSDMEDSNNFIDENSILSSASGASTATSAKGTQAKRGKKRQRVTVPPKSRSKVQKPSPPATKKPTAKQAASKRKALEEQINDRDAEHVENEENAQETIPAKAKKTNRAPAKPRATKKAAVPKVTEEDEMEIEQTPAAARLSHATNRPQNEVFKVASKKIASRSKPAQESRSIVPESHSAAEDEQSEVAIVESVPQPRKATRDTSRSRQEPPYRRRAGSASDTDRGDPNLRRKLGDMTRKFENVDLKYRTLKEVGVNEANANMEKLRKQCDTTVQASNELIASLKKELAAQAPQAQEARKLKKQVQSQETEVIKLRDTATELAQALNDSQNEIKALQAKMAAARASSTEQANSKPQPSTRKAIVQRPLPIGSAEASQAAQVAQMKENLYSDLTGLIIRGVKKTEDGDTYDCIQTGRNGTLHFKLFVDQEDARTASFEETEFLYTPLLDTNRDREMIELMPSYLTEDITFARQNAAKFYGRVVDTLTKRRAEE